MVVKELPLKKRITRLLDIEFGDSGMVSCADDKITVVMKLNDCERNFGNIIQQIHRVIDECYPERREHIFILIRDDNRVFQNVLKIWKSV